MTLIAVRLDDARFGAGPATVVAVITTIKEYYTRFGDRDGVLDSRMRLWSGEGVPGDRVTLREL